jgi:ABC-type transporter Mla MlaB component
MNAATFELTTLPLPADDQAGIRVVQVRGDVDVTNTAEFGEALTRLGSGPLIVDLSQADYFDSAGFAVLARLLIRGHLTAVAAPGSVACSAMTLLGLPFHDTIDSARRALRPH